MPLLRIILCNGIGKSRPPRKEARQKRRASRLWDRLGLCTSSKSLTDGSFYVGHTHDVALRLVHHNDGWTVSTKAFRPWRLVYSELHESKGEAMKHEKQIKRMKSRQYIERLISSRPTPTKSG